MAQKMTLPIDTDIMRMKLQKDLEARHRVELDSKQQELDRLNEYYYESKRVAEVLKTQIESQRREADKEIADQKEKARREISEL